MTARKARRMRARRAGPSQAFVIPKGSRFHGVGPDGIHILSAFGVSGVALFDFPSGLYTWFPKAFEREVRIAIGGRAETWLDDRWVEFRAGMVSVCPAGVPMGYRSVGNSRLTVISVKYGAQMSAYHDPIWETVERRTVRTDNVTPLRVAAEQLFEEFFGRGDEVLLNQWAGLVNSIAMSYIRRPAMSPGLYDLWRQVQLDLVRFWTVEEMAGIVGCSTQHLRTLCKRQLGELPSRRLTRLRLQTAAGLLVTEDLSLDRIARRIGYDNTFAMSRAFSRFYGVSPGQYRSQQRKASGKPGDHS